MTCALALCLSAAILTVTDGDTIRAGDLRLRLWGIDAAELHDPGGRAARATLRGLLSGAEGIACDVVEEDRYGRTVARCDLVGGLRAGADLACELVRLGAATDWPRYSGGRYAACGR